MTYANGWHSPSVILMIVDAPLWARDVENHLTQSGYQLDVVTNTVDAVKLLESHQPDAIIALSANSPVNFFEHHIPSSNPPLRVLITDQPPQHQQDYPADMILSPGAFYKDALLQQLLQMRARNSELQRQIQVLTEENQRISQELQKQKHTSSELELLKNAIVRNVSHELKTPLLQVKSAVSLISEDVKESKLIDYAMNATSRLELLVKNITLLGGSLDINLGPVIIRDAVEYSRRNLRRIWQYKDEADRIVAEIQDNLPPVLADKQGLSTVLQLLMDNALKFSKENIEISAKSLENQVAISVRDFGIGIPKDQIDQIFDSFYQVDNSPTRHFGGTGVGLAIARLILERHNTFVTVESDLGKGSVFTFTLPVFKM